MATIHGTSGWRVVRLLLLGMLVGFGALACTTPYPGYRHEGMGPDERLLDLVDAHQANVARHAAMGPRKTDEDYLLVDSGRVMNELRRLHLEFPTHVPTLFTLASFAYGSGQSARAGGYLDTLFDIQPVHPEAGILRSRIALDEGNLAAARRVLDQQVRYTPDHAGLREAASCVAYLDHDLEQARTELVMARRLGAPPDRVAFNLGLIEEGVGNTAEAIQNYEVALSHNPEFAQAKSRLAGLRALSGDVLR